MKGKQGMNANLAMMGRMKPAKTDSVINNLPGFSGALHLYHLGAENFFLDSGDLADAQQQQLQQLQARWQLTDQKLNENIELSEQHLWQLTSEGAPVFSEIEATIKAIENFKVKQRLGFIQMVGEAATLLTDEQRQQLTADNSPASAPL